MIPRENYMSRIRPFIDTELIKVLTGVRRSGKSVLLGFIQEELLDRGVSPENIIAFNFESLANASLLTAKALYEELVKRIRDVSGRVYLFFDEIQEVQGWEKCLNSARVDFDCDIYVTGSNATLLSGELATYLGGRYVEFVVYPFSFEEFLRSRGVGIGSPNVPDLFRTYMDVGGMPVLTSLPNDREVALRYLMDVYSSIILKDIVRRNNIRDVDLLERIVAFVMGNVGQTFSANSIARYLKNEHRRVAPETVLNYIKACCSAHLFSKVERQDLQGKAMLAISEKYYVVDQGIRQAVFGSNGRDVNQVLENIVCMEPLRCPGRYGGDLLFLFTGCGGFL